RRSASFSRFTQALGDAGQAGRRLRQVVGHLFELAGDLGQRAGALLAAGIGVGARVAQLLFRRVPAFANHFHEARLAFLVAEQLVGCDPLFAQALVGLGRSVGRGSTGRGLPLSGVISTPT